MKYLLDTNVLIDFFRKKPSVERFLSGKSAEPSNEFGYACVTEIEIYAGMREAESAMTLRALSLLRYYDYSREVGRIAAAYLAQYAASHGVELGDALIAATARHYGLVLVTSDGRHFPMKDFSIVSPT